VFHVPNFDCEREIRGVGDRDCRNPVARSVLEGRHGALGDTNHEDALGDTNHEDALAATNLGRGKGAARSRSTWSLLRATIRADAVL
jgi:hypothetical protein